MSICKVMEKTTFSFQKDSYDILLERENILFDKLLKYKPDAFSRLCKDALRSLIRVSYIWGEPLWGKNSYLFRGCLILK